MQQIYVTLPTAGPIQQFVKVLTPLEGDFELVEGRHVLDARSLMGVFSFDLTRPILLRVYNPSPENLAAIAPFVAEQETKG